MATKIRKIQFANTKTSYAQQILRFNLKNDILKNKIGQKNRKKRSKDMTIQRWYLVFTIFVSVICCEAFPTTYGCAANLYDRKCFTIGDKRSSALVALRCAEPKDDVFATLFRSLFPSPEEIRKAEVKRRRAWSAKVVPKIEESAAPVPPKLNYIPPELSESNKVDISEFLICIVFVCCS